MSRKRSTAEKIIGMLREAEVSLAQGQKAGDVCRSLGASEQRGQMNECRVQSARKRRGLPDYPCKSAGVVEYTHFATGMDPRITTECIGCPPDPHPEEWYCAWRFRLADKR